MVSELGGGPGRVIFSEYRQNRLRREREGSRERGVGPVAYHSGNDRGRGRANAVFIALEHFYSPPPLPFFSAAVEKREKGRDVDGKFRQEVVNGKKRMVERERSLEVKIMSSGVRSQKKAITFHPAIFLLPNYISYANS